MSKPPISWIHFGDLHIGEEHDQNYLDFLRLIEEVNQHMRSGVAFCFLPGDNADDGEEDEYALVQSAIRRLPSPVRAITGDHDVAAGNLQLFRQYLSFDEYGSFRMDGYHFVLLNSVAVWHPPVFGLGPDQMQWLRRELGSVRPDDRTVVFMHAYPSEHGSDAADLQRLLNQSRTLLVEMGHTHYNELANDGQIIYAATRSTGQIEEGPPGFSVTTLDDDVVSWKFKPLGEWPFVMITSPSDERLITESTRPADLDQGAVEVRARIWGGPLKNVILSTANGHAQPMKPLPDRMWSAMLDRAESPEGSHKLTVTAQMETGQSGSDAIVAAVYRSGNYLAPTRDSIDYNNVIGEWHEKHILGTQLGPNENGHGWPSRRDRKQRLASLC